MTDSQKKIKLANSLHHTAVPFNLLRGLNFLSYEENLISQNALQLHERKIDLGLIPVTDYAFHGNYVGLDFGIACRKRSDLVMLYAQQDIRKIQTVYYHQKCGSTPLLLKLLLKSRWKVFPRMLRATQEMDPNELGANEALLVIHEQHVDRNQINIPVAEDLVKLWHDWVGLPFVFLIWATRPGVLSAEQYNKVHEVFNICDRVRENQIESLSQKYDLPFGYLTKYQPDRDFYYQIGEEEKAGLETFFNLCADEELLPAATYRSAKIHLLSRKEVAYPRSTANEILLQVADGHRLSIADSLILAEESDVANLGMAADALRSRFYSDFALRLHTTINCDQEFAVEDYVAAQLRNEEQSYSKVTLVFDELSKVNIPDLEQNLNLIKSQSNCETSALSPALISYLCKQQNLDIDNLCSRLAISGLDTLGCESELHSANFATTEVAAQKSNLDLDYEAWSNIVQISHKYGLRTNIVVAFDDFSDWEKRIIYLYKIRFLQDFTNSIQSFGISLKKKEGDITSLEDLLRFVSLARIFLDNIATISINTNQLDLAAAPTCLGFGANSIILDMPYNQPKLQWKMQDFINSLKVAGLRLNIGM